MSDQLKLLALDAEDLGVISAHVQDALLTASDIEVDHTNGLVSLPLKRFAWEAKSARRWLFKTYERRMAALKFSKVTGVKTRGINRNTDQVLSLLAITFVSESGEDPSGTINLTFAKNIDMALHVECIEAQLADLGAVWAASNKPRHAM